MKTVRNLANKIVAKKTEMIFREHFKIFLLFSHLSLLRKLLHFRETKNAKCEIKYYRGNPQTMAWEDYKCNCAVYTDLFY